MRLYQGGTTTEYWLLSDHRGLLTQPCSPSITANADDSLNSEVSYTAFGETRYTTPTATITETPTATPTAGATLPASETPTVTLEATDPPAATDTPEPTPTVPSETPTETAIPTETPTLDPSITVTETPLETETSAPTMTETPTETATPEGTPTDTETPAPTGTGTAAGTATETATATPTETPTSVPVQGGVAKFYYDGNGTMVKSVIGEIVTYYGSPAYQVKTDGTHTNTRKYYAFGNSTIAMRENGVLTWLMNDQVNSTTVTAAENGTLGSEIRYTAFGETRMVNGVTVTDQRYTGQREEAEIGLYYYVARWYDPVLAHFTQADTMVPAPDSMLAYLRYAYVSYNPIRYSDPSGHKGWQDDGGTNITQIIINEWQNYKKNDPENAKYYNSGEDYSLSKAYYQLFRNNPELGHENHKKATIGNAYAHQYSEYVLHEHYFFSDELVLSGWLDDLEKGDEGLWIILSAAAGEGLLNAAAINFGRQDLDLSGLANELINVKSNGQPVSGKFPEYSNNEFLYRVDANGNINSYARYDGNAAALYRVDITGPAHKGIRTPHQQYADWNINDVTGQKFFNGWLGPNREIK